MSFVKQRERHYCDIIIAVKITIILCGTLHIYVGKHLKRSNPTTSCAQTVYLDDVDRAYAVYGAHRTFNIMVMMHQQKININKFARYLFYKGAANTKHNTATNTYLIANCTVGISVCRGFVIVIS